MRLGKSNVSPLNPGQRKVRRGLGGGQVDLSARQPQCRCVWLMELNHYKQIVPRSPPASGAASVSQLISLLHGQSDYSTSDILNKLPSMRLFICSLLEELAQFSLCEAPIDSEDSANYHPAAAGGVMNCVAFSSLLLHEYMMSS